ncbi:MAG TPA: lasso peptide biosynthesis B2 protein [Gammaproteobacteria bacterium]|nr:lasso peptide biosynthesis B2 protein [Gammaproteobacteria bacterium]
MRAVGWLVITRIALRLLPFNRAHALVAGRAREATRDDDTLARAVRRAVLRASRTMPAPSCLAQSMVAERLLRQGGARARLSIGVARTEAADTGRRGLDAHAWVESGGVLVTGDDPGGRYRVLATFGSA